MKRLPREAFLWSISKRYLLVLPKEILDDDSLHGTSDGYMVIWSFIMKILMVIATTEAAFTGLNLLLTCPFTLMLGQWAKTKLGLYLRWLCLNITTEIISLLLDFLADSTEVGPAALIANSDVIHEGYPVTNDENRQG